MTSRIVIAAALMLILATGSFAQMGPGPRGPRGGGPGGPGMVAADQPFAANQERHDPLTGVQSALNLTAAQVESLRTLLNGRLTAVQALASEMQARSQAVQAAFSAASPNATDIGNAILAQRATQNKVKAINDKFQTDFTNLLTADQKQVLESIRAAAQKIPALAALGLIGGGPDFGPMGGPAGMMGRRP